MAHYKDGRNEHLSIRAPSDLIEWIDELAEASGVTRSDAAISLLLAIRKHNANASVTMSAIDAAIAMLEAMRSRSDDLSTAVSAISQWSFDGKTKRRYRKKGRKA